MRLNHMELTFGEGKLTPALKREIHDFYHALFGWNTMELEIMDQKALLLMLDEEVSQFILLAESPRPMSSPGYDHLGLLFDSRAEVDALLVKAKQMQAKDPRIQIKEYDDLVESGVVTRAFYVKHLLPIWFDVQHIEYGEGMAPAKRWRYE
ncbi:MAG TPA: hypothetical protein VL027_10860 [Spongiibacteraceae bacterium]|nr:hypothetical protein [Spongiibacteraceae bacterium]